MARRKPRLLPTTDKATKNYRVPYVHGFGDFMYVNVDHLHPGPRLESKEICASLLDGKCLLHHRVRET